MSGHVILGATFRALGAFPSGWRYPGAHRSPAQDARALRKAARAAEAARLDFLYFGDWLSTGADLQYSDPDLLARIDPLSAVGFLSGITKKIGLIATANTSYSDAYTLARTSASLDRLSAGRIGLNLAVGTDPRAAANHATVEPLTGNARYERAEEFLDALRLLWDSWEDDAFVADAARGRLIDIGRLHSAAYYGQHIGVEGPLNTPRPVQGHVPIVHAGTSLRSRQLIAAHADLAIAAFSSRTEGAIYRAELRALTRSMGRGADEVKLITPVLPVVAETVEGAWNVFDTLVALVPLDDLYGAAGQGDAVDPTDATLSRGRNIRALSPVVGVPLGPQPLDTEVPARIAARFHDGGQRLLDVVESQTGRRVGGRRPVTYRHLLVAHIVPGTIVVGDGSLVADHVQSWFEAGAVDGFSVLSAFLHDQFTAFTELVVPELRRRGLFRTEYTGSTLRDHLGLGRPDNLYAPAPAPAPAPGFASRTA